MRIHILNEPYREFTHPWVTSRNIRTYIAADWRANPRDPKARIVLLLFRICQLAMRDRWKPRRYAVPLVFMYRLLTEVILGFELRPKTRVGPGLAIYHGFGLVINDHCDLGAAVELRNNVTIGSKTNGGPVPVIGNNVNVGAGAIVLGNIEIGDDVVIGAGSVVTSSVPARSTVVGNPARVLSRFDGS